jgi:ABC-type tungstate transport system substrate-binding protein
VRRVFKFGRLVPDFTAGFLSGSGINIRTRKTTAQQSIESMKSKFSLENMNHK